MTQIEDVDQWSWYLFLGNYMLMSQWFNWTLYSSFMCLLIWFSKKKKKWCLLILSTMWYNWLQYVTTGCKGRFDNCGGRNRFLTIYFPNVNTLPNQCVFFFMRFLSLFVSLKFIFYFGINFLILFMFLLCSYISREEL